MDVLHFPDDVRPPWLVHPVLALGNFDGLHRGHLKIIDRVRRGATEHGGTAMAMTFDPHPPRIVRPDKAPPLLMTKPQKLDALRDRPHSTHFTVDQALAEIGRIGPRRAYFTHMNHELGYQQTCSRLPAGVELAYDGLVLDVAVEAA